MRDYSDDTEWEDAIRVALALNSQIGIGVLLGIPLAAVALNQSAGIHELSQSSVLSSALIIGGGVMLVIGLIACTGPTLRALRIAPDEALRQE